MGCKHIQDIHAKEDIFIYTHTMITSISHAKKLHMRVFDRSSVFLTLFSLLGICASRAIHVCRESRRQCGFFQVSLRKLALIRSLLKEMSCNNRSYMNFRHLQVELSFFSSSSFPLAFGLVIKLFDSHSRSLQPIDCCIRMSVSKYMHFDMGWLQ